MKEKFDFTYHLSEGFRSIFTHGFMSFAAVCMIVACLIIMGSFSLVAINLDHNLTQLEQDNEFLAYVDENLTEEQARAIQKEIEAIPNVASATFVTRELCGSAGGKRTLSGPARNRVGAPLSNQGDKY